MTETAIIMSICVMSSSPISRKLVDEHITIRCIFILRRINFSLNRYVSLESDSG